MAKLDSLYCNLMLDFSKPRFRWVWVENWPASHDFLGDWNINVNLGPLKACVGFHTRVV